MYIHSLYSFLTMAFSMLLMPSWKVSRMCAKVSSDLPLKKSSFPRNFCSSSRIEATGLPSMWKGTTLGEPLKRENERHFDGLSFIPMEVM